MSRDNFSAYKTSENRWREKGAGRLGPHLRRRTFLIGPGSKVEGPWATLLLV